MDGKPWVSVPEFSGQVLSLDQTIAALDRKFSENGKFTGGCGYLRTGVGVLICVGTEEDILEAFNKLFQLPATRIIRG